MGKELLAGDCDPGDAVADGVSSKVYKGALHGLGELVKCICCPFVVTCPSVAPVTTIGQGFVGVMCRFGVFERVLPPGMYAYNMLSQQIYQVQMRMQTMEIPRQAAMTQDNLGVTVDAVTFITVVDPSRALFQVEDYKHAVKTLAASTLLRIIAEHDLQQIFTNRARINARLTQTMQEKTAAWGVQVSGVELRDITIPDVMQRAMAQIAEANREAEAKVIIAEGQRKAASVLASAAEIMTKQPISLQLQWFETLRQIASEKNSTVVVPDSLIGSLNNLWQPQRPLQETSSTTGVAASLDTLAAAAASSSSGAADAATRMN